MDWSYELLSQPECKLFGRLSVFTGGFSLKRRKRWGRLTHRAARSTGVVVVVSGQVAGRSGTSERWQDALQDARASQAVRAGAPGGQWRGRVVRRRHADFFVALSEEVEPWLRGAEQAAWFERLDAENDNLRAALSWLLEQGEGELALRLSGALGEFWHVRGHLEEGGRWLEQRWQEGMTHRRGSKHYCTLDGSPGNRWTTSARRRWVRRLWLLPRAGRQRATARALYIQGAPTLYQLDFDGAAALFEEAAGCSAVGGCRRPRPNDPGIGSDSDRSPRFHAGRGLHAESLALAREAGDRIGIIVALGMGALPTWVRATISGR